MDLIPISTSSASSFGWPVGKGHLFSIGGKLRHLASRKQEEAQSRISLNTLEIKLVTRQASETVILPLDTKM
jgi:hypothetical protein